MFSYSPSERAKEIIGKISLGASCKQIASEKNIRQKVLDWEIRKWKIEVGAKSLCHLVRIYLENNWIN